MDSEKIINAFIEKYGTLEDFGNDADGYHELLGAFTVGWVAHREAAEQPLERKRDTCPTCNDEGLASTEDFGLDCAECGQV